LTSGTFTRVRLFTDIEDITLEKWLDADNAGQDDNTELRELADNANVTFGLIVCFGCNRAFDSKDEQVKNCPNCGAKIFGPDLTPPESKKNQTSEKPRKTSPPTEKKAKKQTNHKEPEKVEKQEKQEKQPVPKGKRGTSTPTSPSHPSDEEPEGWFGTTGQDHTGRHAVRSK
jgi:predicted  nucleic acid-binding Zn-ribbon protein